MNATEISVIGSFFTSIAGIAVAFYLAPRRGQRKRLSFRITRSPVASTSKLGSNVTIQHNGIAVGDLVALTVRVSCAGSVPILVEDYDGPLQVQFGSGARLIDVERKPTMSQEPRVRWIVHDDHLKIDPLLLNPGDSFEVTAVVGGASPSPSLVGHIAGVPEFYELEPSTVHTHTRQPPLSIAGAVMAGAVASAAITLFAVSLRPPVVVPSHTLQSAGIYQVYGSCAAGECGLNERRSPSLDASEVGRLPDGSEAEVVCQLAGAPLEVDGHKSRVWDRLSNGAYVSDLFLTTPARGTWSRHLPHCPARTNQMEIERA
jgi:hypothetical protein